MIAPIKSGGEAMPETEEDGPTQVCRLARELSKALDDCEHYHLAIIHPSKVRDYPVELCMDGHHARRVGAMFAYRDALLALTDCRGKSVQSLTAARDKAHDELVASFFEVAS